MADTLNLIADIRGRMFKLNMSQVSLVNKFIELGKITEENRYSFSTQVNFALTGKRTTKRYIELLNEISDVLSQIENTSSE